MHPRLTRIALGILLAGNAVGAEPTVDASQLPRVSPTPPQAALATFQVKPGFRVELAASEPLVVDPIAMSFDEDGRLFVVEMRDYSERRPERLGRIRLLEDTDGDGRFDKSTVYAENLPWPTAVICWGGGVFVGATPDIFWFKDTDGDGRADVKETVFTGFAADYAPFATNKLNVQALMNSFNWSLDNRIHGATSFSGGKVKLVDSPFVREWLRHAGDPAAAAERHSSKVTRDANSNPRSDAFNKPLDLRGRDFSFDPRTLEMRAESGGGQHGMSFDDRGRKFVCSNSDHIQLMVYEDRYAARNSYFNLPAPRVSIAVDGPAAEVFRISPDEPWRVLRTQWRVAGLVPGPVEGGGRPSGYFTGATGVTIYRGDAYGEEFVGDAFIGDAGSNLVHRKKLYADGVLLRAERPPDERKREFLASTDVWFRPVQFANAPDGCLYIADMYREIIEHPWSLPANLKQHLDLNSGNDRGRIYRIVPQNFEQRPLPHLGKLGTAGLVEALESRNGWHRDTAARLLYERQDPRCAALARAMIETSASPLGRLHAMYVLHGMGGLDEGDLSVACTDQDGSVRQHTVRLAETVGFNWMARDPDPLVRFQVAWSIGAGNLTNKETDDRQAQWRRVLLNQTQNTSWYRAAVLNGVGENVLGLLKEMLQPGPEAGPTNVNDPSTIQELVRLIGARNKSKELAFVLSRFELTPATPQNLRILSALFNGLRRSDPSASRLTGIPAFDRILASARQITLDSRSAEKDRLEAIQLTGFAKPAAAVEILSPLLRADQPEAIQLGAATALDGYHDSFVGALLIENWRHFSPHARVQIMNLLLKRKERVTALLDAIDKRSVRPEELSLAQQTQLRAHSDIGLRNKAAQLLGRPPAAARESVVDAYKPALGLKGVAINGQKTFQARCASCHKLGNEGNALGPDLATVKAGGKEKVLVAILDPNREVAPNFLSYSVETKDGESFTGVLGSESGASVTVRMAGGLESVVSRANIASLQSQGRSLMPEGLEEGLKTQDMADLLEFIVGGP
ncbi:MAG: hypothetical protein QOF48_1768 [Verrucomicrobiota bacterium]|jgi:putative membrane-bound dehydrogenase-like protein